MSAYVSFTNYDKDKNELTWQNLDKEEKYKAIAQTGVKLDFTINSKFNLLCSLKRKEKNNNNLNCSNFTTCDNKKYKYCTEDDVGIVCNDGWVYDPHLVKKQGLNNIDAPNCAQTCSNDYFRGPSNFENQSICNHKCSANHNKCKGLTNAELKDIDANISCKAGYKRVNYNCVKEETAKMSRMYYSACLNSPNMIAPLKYSSYFLSVKIKIDKSGENCKSDLTKRLYFVAYPHIISAEVASGDKVDDMSTIPNIGTNYYYENIQTGTRINISNLVNFNWNTIAFHYNEKIKTFKLIINNDTEKPAFQSSTANETSYYLRKIVFCRDNSKCHTTLNDYNLNNNYIWGAAYYKDLKIYNGLSQNYKNFQEHDYLHSFKLVPDLHNMEYNIPFTTFHTDSGNMLGVSSYKNKLDILTDYKYPKSTYYKQLDEFFHYSSKLSVFTPAEKNYFSNMTKDHGKFFLNF